MKNLNTYLGNPRVEDIWTLLLGLESPLEVAKPTWIMAVEYVWEDGMIDHVMHFSVPQLGIDMGREHWENEGVQWTEMREFFMVTGICWQWVSPQALVWVEDLKIKLWLSLFHHLFSYHTSLSLLNTLWYHLRTTELKCSQERSKTLISVSCKTLNWLRLSFNCHGRWQLKREIKLSHWSNEENDFQVHLKLWTKGHAPTIFIIDIPTQMNLDNDKSIPILVVSSDLILANQDYVSH